MIIEEEDLREGELPINKIIHGNTLTALKKLPSESVDIKALRQKKSRKIPLSPLSSFAAGGGGVGSSEAPQQRPYKTETFI